MSADLDRVTQNQCRRSASCHLSIPFSRDLHPMCRSGQCRGRVPASWIDPSLISGEGLSALSVLGIPGGLVAGGPLTILHLLWLQEPGQGPRGEGFVPFTGGSPALLPALAFLLLSSFWLLLQLSGYLSSLGRGVWQKHKRSSLPTAPLLCVLSQPCGPP